jgi:hypothetical protein
VSRRAGTAKRAPRTAAAAGDDQQQRFRRRTAQHDAADAGHDRKVTLTTAEPALATAKSASEAAAIRPSRDAMLTLADNVVWASVTSAGVASANAVVAVSPPGA